MRRIVNLTIIAFFATAIFFAGCSKDSDDDSDNPGIATATTLSPNFVGETTATIKGEVNAGNLETTVTFEYGETTDYGTTVDADPNTVSGSSATSVTANLTGLTVGTTYHYRVVVNSVEVVYGADISFVTDEEGVVNLQDKQDIIDLYNDEYMASYFGSVEWTGNTANCVPGTISDEAQQKTLQRINYYRTMVGLPDVTHFDDALNAKCQQGALMMYANGALSHEPPTTWSCYTAGGADAAGHSNIATNTGSAAIDLYVGDNGVSSGGHRRWILYPPTKSMGHGAASSYSMLWTFGGVQLEPPVNPPEFVAWPTNGYVPSNLIPAYWSFSVGAADFSNTSVTMTDNSGGNISVSLQTIVNGYGDNTIVWIPDLSYSYWNTDETTVDVKVENVSLNGETKNYEYSVISVVIP